MIRKNNEACNEKDFIALVKKLQSAAAVAKHLKISDRAVMGRIRRLESKHGPFYCNPALNGGSSNLNAVSDNTDFALEANVLRDKIRVLQLELAGARKETLTDEMVKRQILKMKEGSDLLIVPDWLVTRESDARTLGVPTLFASDWHWAETVYLDQLNGMNEYNLQIAHTRAYRFCERAVSLLTKYMVKPEYPGIVLALGGDMFSGDIHEELSESNELPLIPSLLDLLGVLVKIIKRLADVFGKVFVPCVTGNHGRTTRKPRAKSRNYTNFDWLLYQLLSLQFQDDDRVQFYIPNSSDAHWKVYNHRYCMTHGDQFRGGDGMIGALGPIIRGDHKKRSRNGQIDLGYDTLLLGHWHQLIQLQRLIVNGSLKGYDEYASQNNFGYEIPQQACWLTHPKHGITFSIPIHLEDKKQPETINRDWLRWAA